jgi:hypothetical protein
MCLHNKARQASWSSTASWKTSNHGHYIIGTDGYIFCDSDNSLNHKKRSFPIDQKSTTILDLSYNISTGILKIIERNKNNVVEMKVN